MLQSSSVRALTLACALAVFASSSPLCSAQPSLASAVEMVTKGFEITEVRLGDPSSMFVYTSGETTDSLSVSTDVLTMVLLNALLDPGIPAETTPASPLDKTVSLHKKSKRDGKIYLMSASKQFTKIAVAEEGAVPMRVATDVLVHLVEHYKSQVNPVGRQSRVSRHDDGILLGLELPLSFNGVLALFAAMLVGLALFLLHRARAVRKASAEFRRRLLSARELERKRLAADLHDGPVQDLQLVIRSCLPQQAKAENGRGNGHGDTRSMHRLLSEVSRKLRNVCCDLRPPVLVYFGLVDAARAHVTEFADRYPNLNIVFSANDTGDDMVSEEIRIALYRILQESLTNIIKHAQARNVHVEIERDAHSVSIEIHDDGRGFKSGRRWADMERAGHLGLSYAAQRAEAVGGLLDVTSEENVGTTVRVVVPLHKRRSWPQRLITPEEA